MGSQTFSVLDLLDLPVLEREIFLKIARSGPLTANELAEATGHSLSEVQAALLQLSQQQRIRLSENGAADVVLGRIRSRKTLPAQLWTALLPPQRFYSEQEIAMLNVAIPILQFARAQMSLFADHGPGHALRVKSFATQLAYVMGLNDSERRLLRAAALLHDVGNIKGRKGHNVVSQNTVERLAASGDLSFTRQEAALVGLLCRWHRDAYEPERMDALHDQSVRTGLLASILRVADAMDIDSRRADYDKKFRRVLEFFFAEELPFWISLEEVLGVRIHCAPTVTLQVFTRGQVIGNIQTRMLREDLAATPLAWSVQERAVEYSEVRSTVAASSASQAPLALLVFPFDAHSLVMAALSRKQLQAAGHSVALLSYPDTADGPNWLWRDALGEMETTGIARLVVIGDRADPNVAPHQLSTIERWHSAGARISILNRHEANWSRIPQLCARGVEVTLGTDWAYFWGDQITRDDLAWARIAALCARDPTMAAVPVMPEEQAIARGLLYVVFQALAGPVPNDTAGWSGLAESILDRIAANDRNYFAAQGATFVARYATAQIPPRVHGRVLLFDHALGDTPQSFYWMLESAIEQHGHIIGRGTRYRTPYAIAVWGDGEQVELFAISHWREEETPPIRLLCPDIEPMPQGTENTILARLTRGQAEAMLARLLDACNK